MAGAPEVNAVQVQATNDSSIVSKASMARLGYVSASHGFLSHMLAGAKRRTRRSPLINRGYYVRAKSIQMLVADFLRAESARPPDLPDGPRQPHQILSLGAGFDTLFFRLCEEERAAGGGPLDGAPPFVVFEVDFPDLVRRKIGLLRASPELSGMLGDDVPVSDPGAFADEVEGRRSRLPAAKRPTPEALAADLGGQLGGGLCTEGYRLVGADMADLGLMEARLRTVGFDVEAPTLVLSECVLTYMEHTTAQEVVAWCARRLVNSAFVLYEQVEPHDCFGRFMRRHFDKLASTLRNIETYPTLASQVARFRAAGWQDASTCSMLSFYLHVLDSPERQRLDTLEPFDEEEHFFVKCLHYSVAVATNGPLLKGFQSRRGVVWPERPAPLSQATSHPPAPGQYRTAQPTDLDAGAASADLKRWGHAAARVGPDTVVVFGGCGGVHHRRLDDAFFVRHLGPGKGFRKPTAAQTSNETRPCARVYHTMVAADSGAYLFGGRSSPVKPLNDVWLLAVAGELPQLAWTQLAPTGSPPAARWRHSGVMLSSDLFVFGGKHPGGLCTPSLFALDTGKSCWREVECGPGPVPPPRHSHAACSWDGQLVVIGGVGSTGHPLADTWVFSPRDARWRLLDFAGQPLPARFGAKALALSDGVVLLVGGVGDRLIPGSEQLLLVDLGRQRWSFVAAEGEAPFADHLLFNHAAAVVVQQGGDSSPAVDLLVLGGGGNCFSFGTHLNAPATALALTCATPAGADVTPSLGPVRRIASHGLTQADFHAVYRDRTPVVFTGCGFGKAVGLWDGKYLHQACPDKEVSVHLAESSRMDFLTRNFSFRVMSFAELIDKTFGAKRDELLYLRSMGKNFRKDVANLTATFPALAADFALPAFVPKEVVEGRQFSSVLRVSSSGVQLWTHFDVMDNLLCNVTGRKRVVMWRPCDVDRLYVTGSTSAVVDIDAPDLTRFPGFAAAPRMEFVLEPGDMLFIPALWFHNVLPLEPCVSVNVFWKHLPDEAYQRKDLYGNKDPVHAAAGLKKVQEALAELAKLPELYRSFYTRKAAGELLHAAQRDGRAGAEAGGAAGGTASAGS